MGCKWGLHCRSETDYYNEAERIPDTKLGRMGGTYAETTWEEVVITCTRNVPNHGCPADPCWDVTVDSI